MCRCVSSFSSDGSAWPTASACVMAIGGSGGDEHLGELPADERRARLVLGDVLGDHVLLAAPHVLVDHAPTPAHAHADADRLAELELRLGVQAGMHDVAAAAQPQRLIGGEGRTGAGPAE